MKLFKHLVIFLFLILFQGCEQTTEPSSDIYIDFNIESDFENNLVSIDLNNTTIFNGKVSTDGIVGLAWSSGTRKLERKEYILNFSVLDNNLQKKYNLDISKDTSTVRIRFDKRTNQITINQVEGRIGYM